MPVTGKDIQTEESGESKKGYSVTFTNGALLQLEELATFFGKESKTEAIELAVSFLEVVKKRREEQKAKHESKE